MSDPIFAAVLATIQPCVDISNDVGKECGYLIYSDLKAGEYVVGSKTRVVVYAEKNRTPVAFIHTHVNGPARAHHIDLQGAFRAAKMGDRTRFFVVSAETGAISEFTAQLPQSAKHSVSTRSYVPPYIGSVAH